MGHWEQQHVGKSYINEMPFEVCLQRAGHPIENLKHFFLPRAQMSEEEKQRFHELADLTFPDAEALYEAKKQVCLIFATRYVRRYCGCCWMEQVFVLCRRMLKTIGTPGISQLQTC
jgi:hypothetical protein